MFWRQSGFVSKADRVQSAGQFPPSCPPLAGTSQRVDHTRCSVARFIHEFSPDKGENKGEGWELRVSSFFRTEAPPFYSFLLFAPHASQKSQSYHDTLGASALCYRDPSLGLSDPGEHVTPSKLSLPRMSSTIFAFTEFLGLFFFLRVCFCLETFCLLRQNQQRT